MVRKLLGCVLALGTVSSAYAVGLYVTPNGGGGDYSYANSVAVAPNGDAYVSGQTWNSDGAYRSAYWKYNSATKSFDLPYVIPTTTSSMASSNSYGIGVLPDGNLVVGGRQTADAAASWTSTPGAANNGWIYHMLPAGGQATTPREEHLIQVKADGTGFWALGKSSDGSWAGAWDVNPTTGTQTVNAFGSMKNASPRDISPNGVVTGTTKAAINGDNVAGVNRAFVNDVNGTSLLPLTSDSDQSHGYGINADGTVVSGMLRWPGNGRFYGAYWTKSGNTWTANWLGELAGSTSTGVALATNEDGTLFGGWGYTNANQAVVWDRGVLDEYSQPKATLLTDYLASYGITDLQGFTRFDKIYDISSVNGQTYISGTGYMGTVSKGFLVVVPEPATGLLLVLGGVAVLRRRR